MPECAALSSDALANFKQEVFAKLAFLGMPHDDVAALRHLWKVVNLSVRLGQNGTEKLTNHPEVPKLMKALSKDLGAPRSDLFVRWLVEKVATCIANPETQGDSVEAFKAASSAIAFLKQEGRLPSSESDSASKEHVDERPSAKLGKETLQEKQEVLDEAWVELKSKEGRKYYWDRRNNACSWSLPAGVRARWVSHKSSDGRTYYADNEGKTCWVMPALSEGKLPRETVARKPVNASAESRSLQVSEDCRFLPEVGVLKPLVLPTEVIEPTAACVDLGPFEAALEPETPVLPASLVPSDVFERRGSVKEMLENYVDCIDSPGRKAPPAEAEHTLAPIAAKISSASLVEPRRLVASPRPESTQDEPMVEAAIEAPIQQREASDTSRPAKDLHDVTPPVQHRQDVFADTTGLKQEVLLLKKQLAELRALQAVVASQAESTAEHNTSQKAKVDEAHAVSTDASSEKHGKEVTGESCLEDKPLKRIKALAGNSGRTSSEEEKKIARTSEEDEWDSWSRTLDALSSLQLPARLNEEQQKMTDAYLSSFDTSLAGDSSSESDEDVGETNDKKRATPSPSPLARKKPRNAIDFWACPQSDARQDADLDAASSSAASQPKVEESSKTGRADSRSRGCHSETKQTSPQENAEPNKDIPCAQKTIDKFLTVVKYGTPPGNWSAEPKSIEEAKATVFEFRRARRPSLGGA